MSKCIDQLDGDIIIDLDIMTLKKIKINEEIQEDNTYVLANGQVIGIKNIDWNIKDTYYEAFGKTKKIKKDDFKFIKIKSNSNIHIDSNYFFFQNNKLIGRIINEGEINKIDEMGIEKFKSLLMKLNMEDIVALVKGKKVYRIFTYSKLQTLNNKNKDQISLYEYINKSDSKEILSKLKKKIDVAYKNLDIAIKYIDEELDKSEIK